MRKSNYLILGILVVASIFFLWMWYALNFNLVDNPLDLVLTIVWWAVVGLGSYFHPELHFRENRSSPAKSLLEFSAWREVRQKVRQISTVFKTGHLQEKNRRAPTNADALR